MCQYVSRTSDVISLPSKRLLLRSLQADAVAQLPLRGRVRLMSNALFLDHVYCSRICREHAREVVIAQNSTLNHEVWSPRSYPWTAGQDRILRRTIGCNKLTRMQKAFMLDYDWVATADIMRQSCFVLSKEKEATQLWSCFWFKTV